MSLTPGCSMTSISKKHWREEDVIIQGWLQKRGEHIKNWRNRYFMLFRDGSLWGFKTQPQPCQELPHNDFTIHGSQVHKLDKPRENVFVVRGLQWTTITERRFCTETAEERDKWCNAITELADKWREQSNRASDEGEDCTDGEEAIDGISMASFDNETGNYSAAANAIMGHPMNIVEGGPPTPDAQPMITIAGTSHAATRDKIGMKDFEHLKVIGKGTFGKVILCKEKQTQKLYALKVLKKEVIIAREEVAHTLTENRVMKRCKHPFLTELIYSFQTKDHLCFVMEFANGGELFTHLQKSGTFSESRTRFYAAEIVLGLGYLHKHSIVYRDMKLENLLLDKDGHIKIADFGLCKEEITFFDKTSTFCGTPEYLAPEVLEDNEYGRSVDWWGFGVVCYEMMVGHLPFYSTAHQKLFEMIMTERVRFPSRMSNEAKELLEGLLTKDPSWRLGCQPEDAMEVTRAAFFSSIDWDKLYKKKIEPPYRPHVESDTDTSYFSREFTSAPVELSPPPVRRRAGLSSVQEKASTEFHEFTF